MTHRTLRPLVAATAATLLALSLSACGDDDSSDDDSRDGGSSSAPIQSGSEGTDQTDQSDQTDGSSSVSDDDLRPLLLTESDLPAGYSATEDDDDDSSDPFEGTCFEDIQDQLDSMDDDQDADAKAEQEFATADTNSSVEVSAAYFEDPSTFTDALSTMNDALSSCTSIQTTTEEGVDIDLTLHSEQNDDITDADSQLEFGLTGTLAAQGQEYPISVQAAIAIAGHTGAAVMTYALGDDPVTDQTVALAQQQLDNIADYR